MEEIKMIDKLYTVEEVCELLKVSRKSLYAWENQGKVTPLRTFGNHRRYTEAMINSILGIPAKMAEKSEEK